MNWKYLQHSGEGEPVYLNGFNVWEFQRLRRTDIGQQIVRDSFGNEFKFSAYYLDTPKGLLPFVYGELSNGIWGFFIPDE